MQEVRGMRNVVLVHGSFHGAWCWEPVIEELRARGAGEIVAVELPFTGFRDDVSAARAACEATGPDTVLCGHSYGGIVISAAAAGLADVRHLVYLAAFLTDVGEDH